MISFDSALLISLKHLIAITLTLQPYFLIVFRLTSSQLFLLISVISVTCNVTKIVCYFALIIILIL